MRFRCLGLLLPLLLGASITPSVGATPPTYYMPIRSVTPGAINPNVTQSNIYSTICVSGWTATVRPSSSYTTALKIQQLQTTYSRYKDMNTSDFEEDHLVPLEVGGATDAKENLWPELYAGSNGARMKDALENRLKALVCAGSLKLAVAQSAIATDWYSAYFLYVGGTGTTSTTVFKRTVKSPVRTKTTIKSAKKLKPKKTGRCWVKSYTTKKGTHVKGHYRKC
ncbi:MAG: hypothetical protein WCK72_00645 [Actinomycetes bacterium]